MDEEKYRVVLTGDLVEGAILEDVVEKLSARTKKDTKTIAGLFAGGPRIIKKGASLGNCRKMKEIFEKAGASCLIEPEGSFEPKPPPLPKMSDDGPWHESQAPGGTGAAGRARGRDEKFCGSCGKIIKKEAVVCPLCGVKQPGGISKAVLLLLTFFLGGIGVHKFYLGKHGQGIAYFLLFWTGIPLLVSFVEFIIYACTGREELQEKYPTTGSSSKVVAVCVGFFGFIFLGGILAAIAIPQFIHYRERAARSFVISELKNLEQAEEAYFGVHRRYTADLGELDFAPAKPKVKIEVVRADEECFEAKGIHAGLRKDIRMDCHGLQSGVYQSDATALAPQPFRSDEGNFFIAFPGRPWRQEESEQTEIGMVQTTIFSFQNSSEMYLVSYYDYPPGFVASEDKRSFLDRNAAVLLSRFGGILVEQDERTLNGYKGTEILFEVPENKEMPRGGMVKARYFLVEDRLYQVMMVTVDRIDTRDTEDFDSFLDSFGLLS